MNKFIKSLYFIILLVELTILSVLLVKLYVFLFPQTIWVIIGFICLFDIALTYVILLWEKFKK